ncbi:MAG: hypothetical protein E7585_07535 [Ruminococcaceae bacterium]|nr:hypothetical protein [Oscillospiraceae bacterium]
MKKWFVWLCALLMLCATLTFTACKPEEQPEGEGGTPEENVTSDDDVVNKDNTQKDDTADDIF